MKYKLYQIRLTDAEVDMINDKGHNSVPKQKAKLDIQFGDNEGLQASEAFNNGFYDHVSNITAMDLEDVFHVGNMGPEENIERFLPMHSVSVGDIVEDQLGHKSVVASFGFKDVA